jgi:hypothetical protein
VRTPKAKEDNPDRKSWSPRLVVGAVGQLSTHHKNIRINAKRPKDTIVSLGLGKLCMHGKFLNKKL